MADANGIIFKKTFQPGTDCWFVASSVDLTAWDTFTVSGCPDSAFNGDYTYDATGLNGWAKNGNSSLICYKETADPIVWILSDGETTYTAPDNGLEIPPKTFVNRLTDIENSHVLVDGSLELPCVGIDISGRPLYNRGAYFVGYEAGVWFYQIASTYYSVVSESLIPPYSGYEGGHTVEFYAGLSASSATLSSTSPATWASASPTEGFISLTDTPDEDFGYVITLDAQVGDPYPYYLYCTTAASNIYGTFPANPTRYGYIFAGWYSGTEGTGTKVTSVTPLLQAADHTLYAKWVANISGPIHNAAGLFSQFIISVGTDVLVEPVSANLSISVNTQITMKIPVSA